MQDETTESTHASHSAHASHNQTAENGRGGQESAHEGHSGGGHDGHGGHEDHGGGHGVDHSGHEMLFRRRFWICTLLSIPVLLYSPMLQQWLGFSMPAFPGSQWIGPLFALIVFAYGGVPFLQMAWPELQDGQPGMMTLISLAITVALVYSVAALVIDPEGGFFWELVTLIDIMLLGHWLEMRSVRQASGALNELAKLMPDEAERVREDGETEMVAVDALQEEDVVLVRPGANVPVDGEVIQGASSVNEALITGESRPVDKAEGDTVIAGATNGDGSLRVRVTATGESTALAGIMRMVQDAQESQSSTQLLADRAAGWLFYIALAAAIVTAIGWTWTTGVGLQMVQRVATVLVIACPHALGLAIPLVVAITTSLGARNGILVRNRMALERARELDTIVFDKTGTLTRGEHGVVNWALAAGGPDNADSTPTNTDPTGTDPNDTDPNDTDSHRADQKGSDRAVDEARAIALAAAVESDSEHMIAQGLQRLADEREIETPTAANFEAIKGKGVRAEVDGTIYYVGGPRLLDDFSLALPAALRDFAAQAGEQGQTVVYLLRSRDETADALAAFALADVIRPESKQAVRRLQEMGIEVAMLTGDSEAVAQAVAKELGIDRVFAEVLPEHKDEQIRSLQEQGKQVAMVGDGVNDAPALTRADVGIAIGSGTDVAVASADIILVQNNPLDVVNILELSRATRRKMVQNLWWAAGYNIVALPLAAGVLAPVGILLSPAVGALLMSLSTIVVAINAQLLRRMQFTRA